MSPITNFGVLALASTVLAVPHANHRHLHARQVQGVAPVAGPADGPAVGPISGPGSVPVPNPDNITGSVPTGPIAGALSGKRGLAYNSVADTVPFLASSQVGWGYNWISNSAGLSNQITYIPTLHNDDPTFTNSWAKDAQAGIDAGSKYLFSFNEPDIPSQANMKPEDAANAWRQHMEPFAGKATLVAPSVSNSESPGQGLDWLKQFMSYCNDCTIGAVNQHWYDSTGNDVNYFQQVVSAAHSQSGLPVFVTEFGFVGSDSQISEALEQAMGWLDQNDAVLGYAYFMVGDGYLNSGGQPSSYGQTYINS